MESGLAASYKAKNTSALWPSSSAHRHLSKKKKNIWSQKDLNKNVHSNFIYNNRKAEQPKCPTGKWINKLYKTHTMKYDSEMKGRWVYPHDEDKSQKLHILKKPDPIMNVLHGYIYIKF